MHITALAMLDCADLEAHTESPLETTLKNPSHSAVPCSLIFLYGND